MKFHISLTVVIVAAVVLYLLAVLYESDVISFEDGEGALLPTTDEKFTWDPVPGAERYLIWVADDDEWTLLGWTQNETPAYVLSGCMAGRAYRIRVQAFNTETGPSDLSDAARIER